MASIELTKMNHYSVLTVVNGRISLRTNVVVLAIMTRIVRDFSRVIFGSTSVVGSKKMVSTVTYILVMRVGLGRSRLVLFSTICGVSRFSHLTVSNYYVESTVVIVTVVAADIMDIVAGFTNGSNYSVVTRNEMVINVVSAVVYCVRLRFEPVSVGVHNLNFLSSGFPVTATDYRTQISAKSVCKNMDK